MKIGVLGLQGDFTRHAQLIARLGYEPETVRYPEQLQSISGLIIPGGESTTMSKLLRRMDMVEPLRQFAMVKPILGTCAGIILIGESTSSRDVLSLGILEISVRRNAYGRQIHSFSEPIHVPLAEREDVRGTFIRAPKIEWMGKEVRVLATREREPVAVEEGFHMGLTFHPELDEEPWFHERFTKHCHQQENIKATDAA
ncbi:MAG: pyridoxal 5'-phosphate synthase glutaminase subunit PdxT [Fidelibacterota bacterium]